MMVAKISTEHANHLEEVQNKFNQDISYLNDSERKLKE
jgi:predicted transglutaminase-like cysteine proteinase